MEMLLEHCRKGDLLSVKKSVESGIDINKPLAHRSSTFTTSLPITEAVRYGQLEIVKYLIDRGAETHLTHLLSIAIYNKNIEIIKFLIGRGFDPWEHDNLPARDAISKGDLEIFKYFVSIGLDVTFDNDYPINTLIECFGVILDPLVSYVIDLVLSEMRKYTLFSLLNKNRQISGDLIPLLTLNRYMGRYMYYRAWNAVFVHKK